MNAYDGKVILITGASDGLGKKVALDLAAEGATVLLHGRSQAKGESTLQEISKSTDNKKLRYYNADLSSLDAVRKFADRVLADQSHLDVLINNAGVGAGSRQALTVTNCASPSITWHRSSSRSGYCRYYVNRRRHESSMFPLWVNALSISIT